RWFIQGTLGILVFGTGLCLFGESTIFKATNPPTWQWVSFGTGALIVVMAGLILIVDSLKYKIYYELEEKGKSKES
ncbi:MAG: hypothetical protein AAF960_23950, partial [Bacteroidota bacterium]